MKNRVTDVRNHLVAMMEALGDKEIVTAEVIERAKALSGLANAWTETVKVELQARRQAGIENELPPALEHKPKLLRGGR